MGECQVHRPGARACYIPSPVISPGLRDVRQGVLHLPRDRAQGRVVQAEGKTPGTFVCPE